MCSTANDNAHEDHQEELTSHELPTPVIQIENLTYAYGPGRGGP